MTEAIRFADVVTHRKIIGDDIDEAIRNVVERGGFILGPEVEALETELAAFSGAADCVTCSSGTDALLLPLMALGVGPGDAVFVPTFTFVATAEVVALLGAEPVFVDSGPDLTIDPESLSIAIKAAEHAGLRPAVIIPVDIFGAPADYAAIDRIGREYGLAVVADAAQSLGAERDGRRVGTLAPITATSFFPAKPLGCYGDGGAVLIEDPDLGERLRSIRVHGKGDHKYENVRLGINGRLDALQAAVLRPKLGYFPVELAARRRVASWYVEELIDHVEIPQWSDTQTSSWAQFTLLADQRDRFIAHLREHGVPSAVYYPTPLHEQPAYAGGIGASLAPLGVAASACERAVSLPIHPYLTDQEIERVIGAVLSWYGGQL